MGYRVTAPYVTVKVSAAPGAALTTVGFYRDAVLPGNVDTESADGLVRKGMVERVSAPAAEDVDPEAYFAAPTGDVLAPPVPAAPVRPAGNAPKPAWVAYAVATRTGDVSEDEARELAESMSYRDLIAAHSGD